MATTGEKIRRLMKQNEMTEEQLATVIGTSTATISNWIGDKCRMSSDKLFALSHVLNVEPGDLENDYKPLKKQSWYRPLRRNVIVNNIRRIMQREQMTQTYLAKQIGVSRQTISSWLRGKDRISNQRLDSIANVLRVNTKELECIRK